MNREWERLQSYDTLQLIMIPLHREIMKLSKNYLAIYKYILNSSMAAKDYETANAQLDDVLIDTKAVLKKLISHENDDDDYQAFYQHIQNTELVVVNLMPIITGLQAKADRTGNYGLFAYRKDLKKLNNVYKQFEHTGSRMNALCFKYL